MATMEAAGSPAPPKGSTQEEEMLWYKLQYEQMELELRDFQESSKELEAEMERDIEGAEKRERQMKEKLEKLSYEVDEWKVSSLALHNMAKESANTGHSQNTDKQRRRRTRRRICCRRRSRLCGIPIGR